ncbi:pyridoxamine 5'-phosphate oxidase family protein [Desulfosarcina sp.]|uniref:pyridoxamine 5'-phosphate oxidase family protein n=1 Tax=Desulfosarcina sp. TaxID=2027861 RepID=UPI0039709989
MNRKQCEITDPEQIAKILSKATIGRLATVDAGNYPYITPVNFVYYQNNIYFHCAAKGEKLENIKRNTKVCFQVDIPLAYLDAGFTNHTSPCNLHQFYHCVILRGRARVVAEEQLKTDALNALVEKHERGGLLKKVQADMADYKACEVVEIHPERISAKSDLAQGKSTRVKAQIAAYLRQRNRPGDLETIREMGMDGLSCDRLQQD